MVFSTLALVGTFAASATAYSATARTFAVNHFYGTGPLLTARIDPIINPGTVGSHNDKSNYWTPSLYFVDPKDASNITAVPMFYMNVYYFFEPTTDKITAFQPGHRMVVGNPALRTPPAGGGASIVDYKLGTPQPVQVTCPRSNYDVPSYPADSDGLHGVGIQDPQNKGAGVGFPDQECDGVASPMRLDAHFPSCYNPAAGLTDYKTNMDWPTDGNCPEGWIHTPHIFYEINGPRVKENNLFVLANGDPTGYSFHADFISGWDVETLQQIIDNCDAGDSGMDKCPGLIGGLNDPQTSCTIKSPINEIVSGSMSILPGSNSLGKWGAGVASVASSVVASATSGIVSQASSVAVGASSAVSSAVAGASSVAASVSNVASSVLGDATSAASISIPSISLPLYQATPSDSAQHSQTHTRNGASTKVAAASSAASEVVSSRVITSGGQVITSVVTVHASTLIYKTVSVTAGQVLPTGSSVSSSTPAAISGYSYAGCYADQESNRALSGVTFADVGVGAVSSTACVAYCEGKGYSVAGTEYGGQCFCGQNLPSQTLNASECAMACEGDANEICGGSLALSVYSKSGASKKEKRSSRHLHRHVQRN
ncbi:WSC domain-containing protein [Botrytis cinerea]